MDIGFFSVVICFLLKPIVRQSMVHYTLIKRSHGSPSLLTKKKKDPTVLLVASYIYMVVCTFDIKRFKETHTYNVGYIEGLKMRVLSFSLVHEW